MYEQGEGTKAVLPTQSVRAFFCCVLDCSTLNIVHGPLERKPKRKAHAKFFEGGHKACTNMHNDMQHNKQTPVESEETSSHIDSASCFVSRVRFKPGDTTAQYHLQGTEELGHLAPNVADDPTTLLGWTLIVEARFFSVEEILCYA